MHELRLRNLHERHRALTIAVGGSYEEAASVCLQRHHQSPVEVVLSDNGAQSLAIVTWIPPDQRTCDAWANVTDASLPALAGVIGFAERLLMIRDVSEAS
jgi:hypothetical protein